MILTVSKNMDGIGVDAILCRNFRVEGCLGVAGGHGWIIQTEVDSARPPESESLKFGNKIKKCRKTLTLAGQLGIKFRIQRGSPACAWWWVAQTCLDPQHIGGRYGDRLAPAPRSMDRQLREYNLEVMLQSDECPRNGQMGKFRRKDGKQIFQEEQLCITNS